MINEKPTIHLVDIPIGGEAGGLWNHLHEEREEICDALLSHDGPIANERRERLQSRLRKIDDALDRLMCRPDVRSH